MPTLSIYDQHAQHTRRVTPKEHPMRKKITLGGFSSEGAARIEDSVYATLAHISPEGDSVEIETEVASSCYVVSVSYDTADMSEDAMLALFATAIANS